MWLSISYRGPSRCQSEEMAWGKGTPSEGFSIFSHPLPSPRMLRNNRISCIHNDSFTGLRNVRLLSLYDNHITTISPGAFDTLQALSTL